MHVYNSNTCGPFANSKNKSKNAVCNICLKRCIVDMLAKHTYCVSCYTEVVIAYLKKKNKTIQFCCCLSVSIFSDKQTIQILTSNTSGINKKQRSVLKLAETASVDS